MEKYILSIINSLKNWPYILAIIVVLLIVFGNLTNLDKISPYTFLWILLLVVFVIVIFGYLQYLSDKNKLKELSEEKINELHNTYRLLELLDNEQKSEICKYLSEASRKFAAELDFPGYHVRANLFAMTRNRNLKLLQSCCHNMKHFKEFELAISEGEGCTGLCYKTGRIQIAVKVSQKQDEWGNQGLKDKNMELINPDLKWIVSVPVKDTDRNVLCVLNLDGVIEEVDKMKIEELSREMLPKYADLIYYIIAGSQKS